MRARIVCFVVLALSVCGARSAPAEFADGDAAWALRAETLSGERANPAPIQEAIRHYGAVVASDPRSLEARWKLLRAYHYAVDFTDLEDDRKDSLLEQAQALAEASLALVEASGESSGRTSARAPQDRARLFFWTAIVWGAKAQRAGLLTIVREGLAGRMHDAARQALDLDPAIDDGGPLRLLARIHATVPRVPFLTGWVDRGKALPFAERAYGLDPEHPGNRLVLALTLLEQAPERSDEARGLLESVAAAEPRAELRAEDLSVRKEARARLEELDRASP